MAAKGGSSAGARTAAAERQQQVILLRIRGVSFGAIAKQLGIAKPSAYALYKKALKLVPKADIEELRKLESERIADIRQRLGQAGRAPGPEGPDENNPAPDRRNGVADRAGDSAQSPRGDAVRDRRADRGARPILRPPASV